MTQPLGVFDYSMEQYHASEGLSRSSLWTFKNLPYKFWYEKLSGQYEPPAENEAYILGDLVHVMMLEPHKLMDEYIISPNLDRRTKEGKRMYEEFLEEATGRKCVKGETWDQAVEMCASLKANSTVGDLLNEAKMEKSIYWKHEATGLICKARPDVWRDNIISDLKTTLDASYRGFQLSAYKYGYFLQAGMIYEAMKSIGETPVSFVNICVEKMPPYAVALYLMDDEALQFGIDMFHSIMERIAICYQRNVWPDYGIQKLTIPNYASMEVQGEQ